MLTALRLEGGQGLALQTGPRALYTVDVKSASVDRRMATHLFYYAISSQLALHAAYPGQGRPAFQFTSQTLRTSLAYEKVKGHRNPQNSHAPAKPPYGEAHELSDPLQRRSLLLVTRVIMELYE
jgi:hypothetical protein